MTSPLPLRDVDAAPDLGTGTALIESVAARRNHRVVATDILDQIIHQGPDYLKP
jgi:hypothetical protein